MNPNASAVIPLITISMENVYQRKSVIVENGVLGITLKDVEETIPMQYSKQVRIISNSYTVG